VFAIPIPLGIFLYFEAGSRVPALLGASTAALSFFAMLNLLFSNNNKFVYGPDGVAYHSIGYGAEVRWSDILYIDLSGKKNFLFDMRTVGIKLRPQNMSSVDEREMTEALTGFDLIIPVFFKYPPQETLERMREYMHAYGTAAELRLGLGEQARETLAADYVD